MSFPSLRAFVDALDAAGELKRVAAPVSCVLEATEVADRVSKSPAARLSPHAPASDPLHHGTGGHALLFEDPRLPDGSRASCPLLMNAFGSYRRIEMALGCEEGGLESLAARVASLVKPEPPATLMGKLKKGLELAKVASLPPRVVSSGPCQEVVHTGEGIDLLSLPVIKCWPGDGDPAACGFHLSPGQAGTAAGGGRYVTLSGVYTIHPDDAGKPAGEPRPSRNVGMYRAQLIDRTRTAMHWHVHHDGASHWRAWKAHDDRLRAQGQDPPGMPCAIVLGGQSVLPYAATAPLPPGISELIFAGFLHGSAIKLVRAKTVDVDVPAEAEVVIEGHVRTDAGGPGLDEKILARAIRHDGGAPGAEVAELLKGSVLEGPFGDHTGFYSLPDRYPVFTASAVTHRRDPIYPATIVGLPPQEDYFLGKATERVFLPLLRTLVPDVLDYDLPRFGCFHNAVFVKIRKSYPLQARRVMHAIWGAGQMAWTKIIVVVDHDVDVHDHEAVLFHAAANADPGRDLELVNGPLDVLDHAAPRLGAGTKIGIDATAKWPGEEVNGQPVRAWPDRLSMTPEVKARVDRRWAELFGG